MDKFKTYLQQHEAEMDTDLPGDGVWQSIRSKTPRQPAGKTVVRSMARYAAAAAVLVLVVLAAWWLITDHKAVPKNKELVKKDTLPKSNENNPPYEVATITPPVVKQKPVTIATGAGQAKKTKTQSVNSEVSMIGSSYNRLISLQIKKLHSTPVYAEGPGYFADFKKQLQQIDKDEKGIKTDIKIYGLSDELLEQLINVYQQKINLLKSLQASVNKMNNKVKEKQGAFNKQKPYYLHL